MMLRFQFSVALAIFGMLFTMSHTGELEIVSICEDPMPCQNGGICIEVPSSYEGFRCNCESGWVGLACEIAYDPALPVCSYAKPCQNGGRCRDEPYLTSRYVCDCPRITHGIGSYVGYNCQFESSDGNSVFPNFGQNHG